MWLTAMNPNGFVQNSTFRLRITSDVSLPKTSLTAGISWNPLKNLVNRSRVGGGALRLISAGGSSCLTETDTLQREVASRTTSVDELTMPDEFIDKDQRERFGPFRPSIHASRPRYAKAREAGDLMPNKNWDGRMSLVGMLGHCVEPVVPGFRVLQPLAEDRETLSGRHIDFLRNNPVREEYLG